MATIKLEVEGMSCNHCVQAVEGALQEIGAKGKVNLEAKSVDIEYDADQVDIMKLTDAIEEQGYDVISTGG
ncbi:copper ion binding protein [Paenibacillus sp. PK4536]|jgi:copper chaperone|uniref:Copper chaperone CopZ n=1 Tax=Paenibacillus nuruki TaxID=1886670 RepID=A0A1E3KY08_9BACL|nr:MULTISPECIES: copper ion binding protein [Paenibacillus]ODP26452.1 Copper chaperone CopZ [Paenibacillus nuruki]TKJ89132.1 copper chaperone [Paenibacillus sp. CFBP13512]WIM40684.1 copper ion binding protein [Paenibacillus sp. PK4536]CAJ1316967.1 Copper chaperone CopZ [Paenibacillus nuruki]